MAKVKKKLTVAQTRARKEAKAERQKKYMWVLMNGKQVRVKRPPTIERMGVDEFIIKNADPIWLHRFAQNLLAPGYVRRLRLNRISGTQITSYP